MTEGGGCFSLGFINNKYGLIFTKLFTERKRWQLRRRLHGNCKEVINKAWNGDIWKWYSQRNEWFNKILFHGLFYTGSIKKRDASHHAGPHNYDGWVPLLSGQNADLTFRWRENAFTLCSVWTSMKLNKASLIFWHRKVRCFCLKPKCSHWELEECWALFSLKPPGCCGETLLKSK